MELAISGDISNIAFRCTRNARPYISFLSFFNGGYKYALFLVKKFL